MKKRILFFITLLVTALLALPAAVYAVEPPPANATYGTMRVEIRYADGESPNIPQTIERFGALYHLVGQSEPVLDDTTMSLERTYSYLIVGAVTREQLEEIGATIGGDIQFTEVAIRMQRTVDKVADITMSTNDVDDIALTREFDVANESIADPDGTEKRQLQRTGVTFTPIDSDDDGLPDSYAAKVVYRGVETYLADGYSIDETFQIRQEEDADIYVIVADYQTDTATPADIVEVINVGGGGAAAGGGGADAGEVITPPVDIADGGVPLDPGTDANITVPEPQIPQASTAAEGAWSLFSLILSAACILIAIYSASRARRVWNLKQLGMYGAEEHLEMVQRRGNILCIMTIIIACLTILTWLLLDDIALGMILINAYTPVIGALFALTCILCIFTNMRYQKIAEDGTE